MASLAFVVAPTAPCGLRRSAAFSQSVKSAVTVRAASARSLKVFASSQPELDKVVEQKIAEAKNVCADPNSGAAECAVAWTRLRKSPPLFRTRRPPSRPTPLRRTATKTLTLTSAASIRTRLL
ncbi:hypothetical protein CLOM_g4196 [Closterium sp. NIES-68]|nr:hypothetical protein CLOM_g4196 [Closterium sp. NIES-68]